MFERALVAVDLSSELSLIKCAPDLAQWGVSKLTLLHLIKSGYGEGAIPGLAEDYRDSLEAAAKELRGAGFEVDVVVERVSDVGDAIVTYSTEFDLVCMGTRSMNLVEDFFLGSTVRTVMRESTVPILLQWVDIDGDSDAEVKCSETLRKALLATDLTHGSSKAHDAAIALAGRGATVDCAYVQGSDSLEEYTDPEHMAAGALDELVSEIQSAGGSSESFVEEGKPVPTLLDLATANGHTMFIVGRSGRNWPKKFVGSTARELCERAQLPVLLVPRPTE